MHRAFPTRAARIGFAVSLSLTLLRLALVAPLIVLAHIRSSGRAIAVIVAVGFVSDVYDGVIARRHDVATAGLRRLDSAVDTVFYLSAAFCVWRLHRDVVMANRWLIAIVIATLVLNYIIELARFGREASYHAWSAKAWGAALFFALVFLFMAGDATLVRPALLIGVVSHVENLAITLTLPEWSHDVRSIFAARALRDARRQRPIGSSS